MAFLFVVMIAVVSVIIMVIMLVVDIGFIATQLPRERRKETNVGTIPEIDFNPAIHRLCPRRVDDKVHLPAPVRRKADRVGPVLFDEVHDTHRAAPGQFNIVGLRRQRIRVPDHVSIGIRIVLDEAEENLLHVRGQLVLVETEIHRQFAILREPHLSKGKRHDES